MTLPRACAYMFVEDMLDALIERQKTMSQENVIRHAETCACRWCHPDRNREHPPFVLEAIREAIMTEREACSKVARLYGTDARERASIAAARGDDGWASHLEMVVCAADEIAAAIRGRSRP